jgi:hypothetical protein
VTARRFPPPWSVEHRSPAVSLDANGFPHRRIGSQAQARTLARPSVVTFSGGSGSLMMVAGVGSSAISSNRLGWYLSSSMDISLSDKEYLCLSARPPSKLKLSAHPQLTASLTVIPWCCARLPHAQLWRCRCSALSLRAAFFSFVHQLQRQAISRQSNPPSQRNQH